MESTVTEIIITEVRESELHNYQNWMTKIHEVEAQFPGFQGIHVQEPCSGFTWITLLQFDSQEHLDAWLASTERHELLKEAAPLVVSFKHHRLHFPFPGWFARGIDELPPPVWKQAMLVLLVLYPIVMLEMQFFNPHLTVFNHALQTFISNTVSVALISWAAMPIVLYFLGWWLKPDCNHLLGTLIVLALYAFEVVFFYFI